ncbi:acyl carrier protein [candidate division KSB1 bacterium]|nr:acyl carrier protein [candidate division KSB1 bacterium]NIR69350.1 acyl carrier protein [candidate division KSB1 bacterium]NIS24168.1 acyl carrier protein [candidate division KSB1 bacterium]NIT71083.1 acyl carrier protein [candidate division KSB1 bacterium]NIU24787.1 acyl carrier protein [candidate division KSB1 bacterium]
MATELDDSIRDRVKQLLHRELKINPGLVKDDSSLAADLGIDSADMVELAFAIEEEFDIEVPDEELVEYTDVRKIVEGIKSKIAEPSPEVQPA